MDEKAPLHFRSKTITSSALMVEMNFNINSHLDFVQIPSYA